MSTYETQSEQFIRGVNSSLMSDSSPMFPVCIELSVKIKRMLDDDDFSMSELEKLISFEPLVASRVMSLANSALYSAGRAQAKDLRSAVFRIGTSIVRTVAYSVCAQQLTDSPEFVNVRSDAKAIWLHTVEVASWAFALAKNSQCCPDEVLLSAVFQNIGRLYILFKASSDPEVSSNKDGLAKLIEANHVRVGNELLKTLGVNNVSGILSKGSLYAGNIPAASVEECLQCACILANEGMPFRPTLDEDVFIRRNLVTRIESVYGAFEVLSADKQTAMSCVL